jgi:hypothetical protein
MYGTGVYAGSSEKNYATDVQYKSATEQLNEKAREFDIQQQMYQQQIADQKAAAVQAGAGLSNLVNTYNKSFNEAKAVNAQHYQQMLDVVNNTSGQRQADIIAQHQQQSAAQMQNLAKLGMGNTTVGSSLQQGELRSQQADLNTLQDTMNQEKLGVIGQYGNIMQSNLPSLTGVQSLITALGSSTGAYGAGATSTALGALQT